MGRVTRRGRWGLEANQIDMSVGQRMFGWGIPPSERRRWSGQRKILGFWGRKRDPGAGVTRAEKGKKGAVNRQKAVCPIAGQWFPGRKKDSGASRESRMGASGGRMRPELVKYRCPFGRGSSGGEFPHAMRDGGTEPVKYVALRAKNAFWGLTRAPRCAIMLQKEGAAPL